MSENATCFFSSSMAPPKQQRRVKRAKSNTQSIPSRHPYIPKQYSEYQQDPVPPPGPLPVPSKFSRSCDLLVVSDATFPTEEAILRSILLPEVVNKGRTFLNLLIPIRRRIYRYCFTDDNRPIILSNPWTFRATFGPSHFARPSEILKPILGALSVPYLRDELLSYYWSHYSFHISISPFGAQRPSPFLDLRLSYYFEEIQHLTVELDLTRFACGTNLKAALCDDYAENIRARFNGVLCRIMKRKNPTISEFNLMCRRYAGLRPLDDKPETEDYTFKTEPFCPDKILGLSISIIALRGFVGKCRISGFPEEYTRALLKSLFCKKNENPTYAEYLTGAWPPLPAPPVKPILSHMTIKGSENSENTVCTQPKIPNPKPLETIEEAVGPIENNAARMRNYTGHSVCVQPTLSDLDEDERTVVPDEPAEITTPRASIRVEKDDSSTQIPSAEPETPTRPTTPISSAPAIAMNNLNELDPAYLRTMEALAKLRARKNSRPSPSKIPRPKTTTDTTNTPVVRAPERAHLSLPNELPVEDLAGAGPSRRRGIWGVLGR